MKLDSIIKSKHVQYLQINYFLKHSVKNSDITKFYKDMIKVYWSKRLQTIECIFKDLREIIYNPEIMYALYDIYNKFYLAVIFYEVAYQVIRNYKSTKKNFEKLKEKFNFEKYDNASPDDLISFKIDINNIFYLTSIKNERVAKMYQTRDYQKL